MPRYYKPANGNIWRNGSIDGTGKMTCSDMCVLISGNWQDQKLTGNCFVIDYSGESTVVITEGNFTEGKKDGTVNEYEINKSDWGDFYSGTITSSTKYVRTYSDNSLISTDSTTPNVSISGTFTSNGPFGTIDNFSYSEV